MNLFEKLKSGLNEAIEFEKGDKKAAARVRVVNMEIDPVKEMPASKIKELRLKQKLNQKMFAVAIGVSPETVAKWEQGINKPKGSSLRLLQIVSEHPKIIEKYAL